MRETDVYPEDSKLKVVSRLRHVEVVDLTDDNDSVHCCCRKTSRTSSNTSNTRTCAELYSFFQLRMIMLDYLLLC